MEEWEINNQMQRLFNYQVIIGIISNITVALSCYLSKDTTLFKICILLLVLTLLAYSVSKYVKLTYGVHLMLVAYFSSFFYAAFTPLVTHPLILVYPIISGLAILYSKNNSVRFIYALFCFAACAYTVYLQQVYYGSTLIWSENLSSILISIGLMIAFPIIIIINSNILKKYQDQLEKKQFSLKRKNKKLNTYISSNLQLENFAYLASHELKTPLKNVVSLTALLEMKTKDKLEEKELEIMKIVTSEVEKMDKLIEDLLQYSLVKNTEFEVQQIGINQLLDELLESYFKESKALIKIDIPFTTVVGNKDLISQLFSNLIENGLKFSKKSKDQNIEITGSELPDFYQFSICDNGIGIDPEFEEHIFMIFKRLNQNSEYPGTGIGLTICKNIVERHGGSIWVKANPEKGTIMMLTLSKMAGKQELVLDTDFI